MLKADKLRLDKLEQARQRRERNKEPRDWKQIGWAYVLHFIQGGICGYMAFLAYEMGNTPLAMLSVACVAQYGAYQGLSFARKRDTVGRDMADFGAGYAVGAVIGWLL